MDMCLAYYRTGRGMDVTNSSQRIIITSCHSNSSVIQTEPRIPLAYIDLYRNQKFGNKESGLTWSEVYST